MLGRVQMIDTDDVDDIQAALLDRRIGQAFASQP
jgi:hypothetical protein